MASILTQILDERVSWCRDVSHTQRLSYHPSSLDAPVLSAVSTLLFCSYTSGIIMIWWEGLWLWLWAVAWKLKIRHLSVRVRMGSSHGRASSQCPALNSTSCGALCKLDITSDGHWTWPLHLSNRHATSPATFPTTQATLEAGGFPKLFSQIYLPKIVFDWNKIPTQDLQRKSCFAMWYVMIYRSIKTSIYTFHIFIVR